MGTLGPAIRCFAPVIGADGRAIGAVVVGYLMQTVEGIYLDRIALLISAIGAVLGCGLLLALWISIGCAAPCWIWSRRPSSTASCCRSWCWSTSRRVIALDSHGHIRMLNSAAFYQLRLPGTGRHSLLGQPLAELSPPLAPP